MPAFLVTLPGMGAVANNNFQGGRIHPVLFKDAYQNRQIVRIATEPGFIGQDQNRTGKIKRTLP